MANGATVALHTVASPAPDGVLQFVSANEAEKKNKVQEAESNKVRRDPASDSPEVERLAEEYHEPGKMHR